MMRNVLLAVTGGTPQVITETIYGLAMMKKPVYVEELHVVTTLFGKRLIEDKLLREGHLEALLKQYNLPEIDFSSEHIHVITTRNGRPIKDILTEKHSQSTADLIMKLVRDFTENPEVALHCSIAGGRKTMSFYLGAALQLFGRPQDKLYHVLVSAEFENNPGFFFPPKRPVKVKVRTPEGKTIELSTSKAKVHLVELPYLRLRDKLPLYEESFEGAISVAQHWMDRTVAPLVVLLKQRCVMVGQKRIPLQPMVLAIYSLLAYQKKTCKKPETTTCSDCDDCYLTVRQLMEKDILKTVRKIINALGSRAEDDRWQKYEQQGGLPESVIRQSLSRIDSSLKRYLRAEEAELYCVDRIRRYGDTRYGIRIDRRLIEIKTK